MKAAALIVMGAIILWGAWVFGSIVVDLIQQSGAVVAEGGSNVPPSTYPKDSTWPAPSTYPVDSQWSPPTWGTYPVDSSWPGTTSHPCCSR